MAYTRAEAITRIAEGLGFRSGLDTIIVRRLDEAQRDLERGKTLPDFLLSENATLTLLSGEHVVNKPANFLRQYDEQRLHFTSDVSDTPVFLVRKRYEDALQAQVGTDDEARAPSVYVVFSTYFDFIATADQNYTFTFSYYEAEPLISTLGAGDTNGWLTNAWDWIVGEAGYRLARDLRDKDGMSVFADMRTQGRSAVFGEQLAAEDADGPIAMGSDQ